MAKKALNEMSFLDHLEELRWLLVRSTSAVLIMAVVTYFFSDFIFDTIIFAPTSPDFLTYTFFCDLSHQLGFADSICITELPFIIVHLDVYYRWIYTRISIYFMGTLEIYQSRII